MKSKNKIGVIIVVSDEIIEQASNIITATSRYGIEATTYIVANCEEEASLDYWKNFCREREFIFVPINGKTHWFRAFYLSLLNIKEEYVCALTSNTYVGSDWLFQLYNHKLKIPNTGAVSIRSSFSNLKITNVVKKLEEEDTFAKVWQNDNNSISVPFLCETKDLVEIKDLNNIAHIKGYEPEIICFYLGFKGLGNYFVMEEICLKNTGAEEDIYPIKNPVEGKEFKDYINNFIKNRINERKRKKRTNSIA
jgi:hypothetical protein